MYMAYKHSNRFCWNVPTWCSWASRVQASHHGVQLPAQSSACVPRGIVPTSHRCSIMATSLIRHPSAPMTDGLTVWLVRRPGIPCRTACGIRILEATVSDNLWRCFCSQRTDAFSALEVSRRIDDALYKSTFYLLTYWKACRNLPVDDSVGWAALSVVLAEGLSGTKYSSLSGLTARQLPSSLNWISVQLTSLLKMSANNLENKLTKSYHYVLTSFLFRNRQLHQPGL